MNPLIKTTLISGLATFAICWISILFKAAFVAFVFITILPGPAYGIILLLYSGKLSSLKTILFLLLTMLLYYSIIYFLNLHDFTDSFLPYKIFISSICGSVLLKLLYDLIIEETFSFKSTVASPFLLGAISSILPSISAFGFQFIDDKSLFSFISIGLLSIFPLWQYLFSINMLNENEGKSLEK